MKIDANKCSNDDDAKQLVLQAAKILFRAHESGDSIVEISLDYPGARKLDTESFMLVVVAAGPSIQILKKALAEARA